MFCHQIRAYVDSRTEALRWRVTDEGFPTTCGGDAALEFALGEGGEAATSGQEEVRVSVSRGGSAAQAVASSVAQRSLPPFVTLRGFDGARNGQQIPNPSDTAAWATEFRDGRPRARTRDASTQSPRNHKAIEVALMMKQMAATNHPLLTQVANEILRLEERVDNAGKPNAQRSAGSNAKSNSSRENGDDELSIHLLSSGSIDNPFKTIVEFDADAVSAKLGSATNAEMTLMPTTPALEFRPKRYDHNYQFQSMSLRELWGAETAINDFAREQQMDALSSGEWDAVAGGALDATGTGASTDDHTLVVRSKSAPEALELAADGDETAIMRDQEVRNKLSGREKYTESARKNVTPPYKKEVLAANTTPPAATPALFGLRPVLGQSLIEQITSCDSK